MDAVDEEGDDALLARCGAVDPHPLNLLHLARAVVDQLSLVRLYLIDADLAHVLERCLQPEAADEVRRPGLKLIGQVGVRGVVKGDVVDHLPAALIGRYPLQPLPLAVEDADAGRAVDLVPAESEEVAVPRLHVYRPMGDGLSGIDEAGDTVSVSYVDDLAHRIDGAEDVGEGGDSHHFRPRGEELLVRLHIELSLIANRDHAELGALELPGDDIGVVLHRGDDHFVTRLHKCSAVGVRHGIDAVGGASREDHLRSLPGVDKTGSGLPCRLVRLRRHAAEVVDATMDIRIGVEVALRKPIDDALRTLCRGSVVEVGQRYLLIYGVPQGGEVLPQSLYIYSHLITCRRGVA